MLRVSVFFWIIILPCISLKAGELSPSQYLPFLKQQQNNSDLMVRVLIGKDLDHVEISGRDLVRKLIPTQQKEKFQGGQNMRFQCSRFLERRPEHSFKRVLLASINSQSGVVGLGREKFKGYLQIIADQSRRTCDVVNEVSMEDYLAGLLSREMNASWPIEALKAQAVAARTYALYKIQSRQESRLRGLEVYYDLENSERHQVSGSFLDATTRTQAASMQTRGEFLVTKDGQKMTPVFFHASCGGMTREPQKVWRNSVRGYQSVDCEYCHHRRSHSWSTEINIERMRTFLKWAHENQHIHSEGTLIPNGPIRIIPSLMIDPQIYLYLGDQLGKIHKNTFRRYFGRVEFPSGFFSIRFHEGAWQVVGQGNGHGVGLCQVGAYDLARRGMNYRQILQHYFPGHQVVSLY